MNYKMKYTLLIACGFAIVGAQAQTVVTPVVPVDVSTVEETTIAFEQTSHDFGNVIEGELATYEFKFKNNGKDSLKLTYVKASCGCTTPTWTQEAIAPGAEGLVTAQYNSRGRPGSFNKTITVRSTGGDANLGIRGVVVAEPEKPKSPIIIGQ